MVAAAIPALTHGRTGMRKPGSGTTLARAAHTSSAAAATASKWHAATSTARARGNLPPVRSASSASALSTRLCLASAALATSFSRRSRRARLGSMMMAPLVRSKHSTLANMRTSHTRPAVPPARCIVPLSGPRTARGAAAASSTAAKQSHAAVCSITKRSPPLRGWNSRHAAPCESEPPTPYVSATPAETSAAPARGALTSATAARVALWARESS
mmetsp:Transcript_5372/g.21179  ORF Transcript_5372/g.21179 Transcript_5372/m.21179 type:complete len:215 (-) Transcript_5372:294-938(-)